MVCALQLLISLPPALPRLLCPNIRAVCEPCILRPAMRVCCERGCPSSEVGLQAAVTQLLNKCELHGVAAQKCCVTICIQNHKLLALHRTLSRRPGCCIMSEPVLVGN